MSGDDGFLFERDTATRFDTTPTPDDVARWRRLATQAGLTPAEVKRIGFNRWIDPNMRLVWMTKRQAKWWGRLTRWSR